MDKSFWKGLCVGFCITFLITVVFVLLDKTVSLNKASENLTAKDKIDLLLNYVDMYYDGAYETDDLYDGAYEGLIAGLGDKYSAYYSEEDYEVLLEKTNGTYVGIGAYVSLSSDGNYPMIVAPIEGSSSEAAGLLAGDIVMAVDGESMYQVDLDTAVALIKGEAGTEVVLTIKREGESEYLEYTITRATVVTQSVSYEMLENNVGYVAVSSFESPTSAQFNQAISDLESEGMESLIIDLRDNPGGLLNTACMMLDRILPKGKLLVYMLDKNDKRSEEYSEDNTELDIPIVILMNGNSASASEVFAGCLKDYDAATIVGETSFGKGIVQTVFTLSDGSRIKLTTASYYSPNGTNIHGVGIQPDIEVTDDPETEEDEQLLAAIKALTN